MASPSISASSDTSSVIVNGTSHTVVLPAGSSGDLIIIILNVDETGVAPTTDDGSTWTRFGINENTLSVGDAFTVACYYKVAGASEANPTFTIGSAEKSSHLIYRITGHESPGTQAPEIQFAQGDTTTSADPPAITPTGGSKDYLFIAGVTFYRLGRTVSAYPTSYTTAQLLNEPASSGCPEGGCAARALTASSENPATFTMDDSATLWFTTYTIAVHPSGGGGGSTPRHDLTLMGVS